MTRCAVRGLETSGGRINAVVTEKGVVKCRMVVLAGGAWSGLFCRSLGLRLPQLMVLESVLRTAPVANGPVTPAWAPDLAIRPRLDGGYTVSDSSALAPVVPDSFRYLRDFLPLLRSEWAGTSLRFGRSFFTEWRLQRPWALDAISPFERVRMLDPAPDRGQIGRAHRALTQMFPAFAGVPVLGSRGGMVDITPDMLPVISEVSTVPGLVVSTGYSGHGFGIGPGAGTLTADLAMGIKPIVDPRPFRFSRFAQGAAKAGLKAA